MVAQRCLAVVHVSQHTHIADPVLQVAGRGACSSRNGGCDCWLHSSGVRTRHCTDTCSLRPAGLQHERALACCREAWSGLEVVAPAGGSGGRQRRQPAGLTVRLCSSLMSPTSTFIVSQVLPAHCSRSGSASELGAVPLQALEPRCRSEHEIQSLQWVSDCCRDCSAHAWSCVLRPAPAGGRQACGAAAIRVDPSFLDLRQAQRGSLQQLRSRAEAAGQVRGRRPPERCRRASHAHNACLGAAALWVGVCMARRQSCPVWPASRAPFGHCIPTADALTGRCAWHRHEGPPPPLPPPLLPAAVAAHGPTCRNVCVRRLGAMASAYTLCRGNVGGVASIGKGRLLVSVQGDGVSCYDTADRVSGAAGSSQQSNNRRAARMKYALEAVSQSARLLAGRQLSRLWHGTAIAPSACCAESPPPLPLCASPPLTARTLCAC